MPKSEEMTKKNPMKGCWDHIFTGFQLVVAFHVDITLFLSTMLKDHSFKDKKGVLWNHMVRATLWQLWLEHNNRVFNNKIQFFGSFFYHVVCNAIAWCKLSAAFKSHSFASLLVNWRCNCWNSNSVGKCYLY